MILEAAELGWDYRGSRSFAGTAGLAMSRPLRENSVVGSSGADDSFRTSMTDCSPVGGAKVRMSHDAPSVSIRVRFAPAREIVQSQYETHISIDY